MGVSRPTVIAVIACCVGSVAFAACGGSSTPQTRPAPTVTVFRTATSTVTVSDSYTSSPSVAGNPPDSVTSSPSSSGSGVLQPSQAGKVLTLTDFFNPDQGWSEAVVDVANQKGLQGIVGEVTSCSPTSGFDLELRLADNFQKLTFEVGQANTSSKSDQSLVIMAKGETGQIAAKSVPFNQVQDFSISVASVNALDIRFSLDPQQPHCGGEVDAVLFNALLT